MTIRRRTEHRLDAGDVVAHVHDWSGVAMAAGVALHLVLHAAWLMHMTRKIVRGDGRGRSAARPQPPRRRVARRVAATSLSRLQAMGARDEEPRRMNRKVFLLGAAAVGGAAVLAGVGLAATGGNSGPRSPAPGPRHTTSATGTSSPTCSGSEHVDERLRLVRNLRLVRFVHDECLGVRLRHCLRRHRRLRRLRAPRADPARTACSRSAAARPCPATPAPARSADAASRSAGLRRSR